MSASSSIEISNWSGDTTAWSVADDEALRSSVQVIKLLKSIPPLTNHCEWALIRSFQKNPLSTEFLLSLHKLLSVHVEDRFFSFCFAPPCVLICWSNQQSIRQDSELPFSNSLWSWEIPNAFHEPEALWLMFNLHRMVRMWIMFVTIKWIWLATNNSHIRTITTRTIGIMNTQIEIYHHQISLPVAYTSVHTSLWAIEEMVIEMRSI